MHVYVPGVLFVDALSCQLFNAYPQGDVSQDLLSILGVPGSSKKTVDRSPCQPLFTRGLLRVRAAPQRPVLVAAPRRIAGAPKNLIEAPFTSSQALSAGRTRPKMSAPNRSAAKKVRQQNACILQPF